MRIQIITGVRALIALTVLTGLIFPLVMTGLAQVAFHDKANGSLVERAGHVVGSELVGQAFSGERCFQPRPSSAGAAASGAPVDELGPGGAPTGGQVPADPHDLSLVASGASNLGPTNDALLALVAERVAAYRAANGLDDSVPVPVDAVTASGSGVDPDISLANAHPQAPRVAARRGMALDDVVDLVARHTTKRVAGVFGEPGVNVLTLNLALDDAQAQR